MNYDPTDDELLRSYLLGDLPEEESERLERRLLAEDDLFELSEAIEADLLGACDRGELTVPERERVLRRLASSPSGRERLALARGPERAGRTRTGRRAPPFAQRAAAPARARRSAAAALAAGLVLASGLSWWLVKPHQGGGSAPWIARERPAPASPVAPRPPEAQALAKPPAPKAPPEPLKSVFQLALTSLRGTEAPDTLRIRPGSDVELRISVEGMEDLKSFHLAVRNRKAQTLWEGTLEPTTLQGVRVVVIDLPAGRLTPGPYEIAVRGLAPRREPEDLSPLDVVVVREGKS